MNPTNAASDTIRQMGTAAEWSSAGGLPGLVIFALFLLLTLVSVLMMWWHIRSDSRRQDSLDKLIQQLEAERLTWQKLMQDSIGAQTKMITMFDSVKIALQRIADAVGDAHPQHGDNHNTSDRQ